MIELYGVISGTHPSTLYMDGRHPIGVMLDRRPDLSDLDWRKVKIIVLDEYDRPWERDK